MSKREIVLSTIIANLVKTRDAKLKGLMRITQSQPAAEGLGTVYIESLCKFPPLPRSDGRGVRRFLGGE